MITYTLKDKRIRKFLLAIEVQSIFLRYALGSKAMPPILKQEAFFLLVELNKNLSFSKTKNRCIVSGRSRSNCRKLGLSRLAIKRAASEGVIPGFQKAKW
jgi:ribosomal protein S14